jgi:head-tail adaptor
MTRGAGMLRERVLCQKKGQATDELGNPVPGGSEWATQFSVRAGFRPRNGGETALAGRLQGVQPYIVTLRSSENTRQITAEWRLVDARDATRIFAVRSLSDPDGKRQWLELLVEQGAAG